VTVPTTIVTYPTPYSPSYDTIASLVDDSGALVIAVIGPEVTPGNYYPLQVQQSFGPTAPRVSLNISSQEFNAAQLAVGNTYFFFYGVDPVDKTECIVGGVRGVFAIDVSTETVSRISQSTSSQIPNTETLAQFENAVNAAMNADATTPIQNIPPVCAASATGL
jgi:hypothetical protein